MDQAIATFRRALQIDPQHASAEFALARALQRSGHADEAKEHFARFQHLTSAKISHALGLSYGEQGRLSTVVPASEAVRPKPAMIPVHFTALSQGPAPSAATALAASGGACVMDVDGDGIFDLVLMQNGPSAIRVMRNMGGSFEVLAPEKTGLVASGNAISCAVGDFDGDGLNDLAVALDDQLLLFRNLGHGRFENVTVEAGLKSLNHPQGITFVDYDHDGDLDLFITGAPLAAGGSPNVLWRNNGNATFTEWTEPTGLGGSGSTKGAILSDINNDRAVDIVVAGDRAAPIIYLNPREGKFNPMPLFTSTELSPAVGVSVLDFDKDGWMDIAVTHSGAPGVSLWRNKDGKSFERVPLPTQGVIRAWGLTPIDLDNDGWLDLAVIVETVHGAELRVFRNQGGQTDTPFVDISKTLGLDHVALKSQRGLIAMDVDGDGAADLIVDVNQRRAARAQERWRQPQPLRSPAPDRSRR